MWSASSSTVISTASRRHEALLHEVFEAAGAGDDDVDAGAQRRRPGGFWLTPPKIVVVLQAVRGGERLRVTAAICVASSRVGASTRPSGRPGRRRAAGERRPRRATMGSANAMVLPRAGLAAAEHVAAGEGVGQGVDLDRERGGLAVAREDGDEGGGHAERAEGDVGHMGAFQGRAHRRIELSVVRKVRPGGGYWRRRRSAHPFAV